MGSVNFIAGGGVVKECWAKAFYLVRGFAEGVITTAGLGMTVRRAPAGGMADQPIDVVLNGNVVARGQLVVVDNNFGVRITEVAQAEQP